MNMIIRSRLETTLTRSVSEDARDRPRLRFGLVFCIVIALAACGGHLKGDDWPQWRGPTRDDVWKETGIVEKFTTPQIPILWRAAIGGGYSAPTVADGRVYVTDLLTDPHSAERVHCFDWKTGHSLWSFSYDCTYDNVGFPAGPRAAVSIDDGRAYTLGAMGHLHCLDAATGKLLWKKEPGVDYKVRVPVWGIASAPLVDDDLVIVQLGGTGACLVALDKKTGVERWRALDDRASYSAPIIIQQAGKRVLVCWTGDNVVGLNPATGDVYWKYPFPPEKMVINVPTPVVSADRLFLTGFYDGALMLKLGKDQPQVEKLWRRKGAERGEERCTALHDQHAVPRWRLCLRRGQLWSIAVPGRAHGGPCLGGPDGRAQGPLVHHPHGPQWGAGVDVQRARES